MAEQVQAVLVSDLPPGTTNHDVWHFALIFGSVKSTVLNKPKKGEAIVIFDDDEGVKECLANFQDSTICGKYVSARLALDHELEVPLASLVPEGEAGTDLEPPTGHKDVEVYVCGIPAEITQSELEEYMSKFGHVENVNMTTNASTASRSFAYVTFADKESADKALQNFHFNAIRRKWFEVRPSAPENLNLYKYENKQITARKVYVTEISSSVTDDDFLDHFAKFGPVLASHRRKGFGFVLYERPSGADNALATDRHDLYGRRMILSRGSVEESRERRYQRLTQKYGMEVPDWPGNPEIEMYRDVVLPKQKLVPETRSASANDEQDNDAWWWKGVNAVYAWLDNEAANESSARPCSESAWRSRKTTGRDAARSRPY